MLHFARSWRGPPAVYVIAWLGVFFGVIAWFGIFFGVMAWLRFLRDAWYRAKFWDVMRDLAYFSRFSHDKKNFGNFRDRDKSKKFYVMAWWEVPLGGLLDIIKTIEDLLRYLLCTIAVWILLLAMSDFLTEWLSSLEIGFDECRLVCVAPFWERGFVFPSNLELVAACLDLFLRLFCFCCDAVSDTLSISNCAIFASYCCLIVWRYSLVASSFFVTLIFPMLFKWALKI